jgi:site-specific DNA recombinase
MDGELLLTILSGLAESESVFLSENSKWSIKARMQNGTYKLSKAPFGYNISEGILTPNPEQAEVVKRIFAEFLSGKGYQTIIITLHDEGIKPMRGGRWTDSSIHWILVNERYIGDVRLQKTYSDGNFQQHINYGEVDQYYIRDHHEPIISREDFEKAQEVLEQRRKASGAVKGSHKYMRRYTFSGKIACGLCGGRFKRFARQSKYSELTVDWRCENHRTTSRKTCTMPNMQEEGIQAAFTEMMKRLFIENDTLIKPHIRWLKEHDGGGYERQLKELESSIQSNAERAQTLTGFMSKGYLTPALFTGQMNELQAEAVKLKERKAALDICGTGRQSAVSEAEALYKFLSKDGKNIETYDEGLFQRFADAVTMLSHNEIQFHLKCGLLINEALIRIRRTSNGIKPTIQWNETKWAKKKGAAANGSS